MVCPPWKTKSWLGVGATPGAIASVSGIDILDRKPFSALVPWPTNTRKGRTCFDLSAFMTFLQDDGGETGKSCGFKRSGQFVSEYCLPTPPCRGCQSIDLLGLSSSTSGGCDPEMLSPPHLITFACVGAFSPSTGARLFLQGTTQGTAKKANKSITAELLRTPWVKDTEFGV